VGVVDMVVSLQLRLHPVAMEVVNQRVSLNNQLSSKVVTAVVNRQLLNLNSLQVAMVVSPQLRPHLVDMEVVSRHPDFLDLRQVDTEAAVNHQHLSL
jgi:hypothetical protein